MYGAVLAGEPLRPWRVLPDPFARPRLIVLICPLVDGGGISVLEPSEYLSALTF